MPNFNKVFLMGNLTKDPESLITQKGTSVCHFSIAINESYRNEAGERIEKEPIFIDISTFAKMAESCQQYLHKGSPVFITGKLVVNKWEKDGQKFRKLKVIAQNIQFLTHNTKQNKANTPEQNIGGEEDIPF